MFVFLKYLFPVIKIYYLLLEKYFLYACAEPLFYFASWQHACTNFCSWYLNYVRSVQLFVRSKRYAFVRSNTDVRALWKNIWKIKFSKYSQVWSYYVDLDVRNTMVRSEFNLDIHSGIYEFFRLKLVLHVSDVIILCFLYVCTCPSLLL